MSKSPNKGWHCKYCGRQAEAVRAMLVSRDSTRPPDDADRALAVLVLSHSGLFTNFAIGQLIGCGEAQAHSIIARDRELRREEALRDLARNASCRHV